MVEPLSTAASVVGIIVPVMHGIRLLLTDIEKIADAPKTVARLKDDLHGFYLALEGLKAVDPSELESLGVAQLSLSAIKTCNEACETFRKDLQRWTKHSEDGKLSQWDRLVVGYQDEKIKSMSKQFQNCKITLLSAVSIATLHISIRQSGMTTEIREKVTKSEVEIVAAIKSSDIQIMEVENSLKQVSLADPGQEGDEATEKTGALKQIKEEQKALSESRELLEALLAKTKDRSGISVTNIRMSDQGKVLAGVINTGGKYTDAHVVIDNVEANSGGQAITGIVEGLTYSDFFK